jgi:tripartite-type tricarboxylate transporter receptor subunit TctC
VRLIASNAGKRSTQEPNVPTISEVIPGFDFAPIVGVLASTGTPQAAMDRISAEMTLVAKQAETIQILSNAGIEAIGGSGNEYARAIADENERLGKAVHAAGIKQQE